MFYDLNELVTGTENVDRFTLSGVTYELGEIGEKYIEMIRNFDNRSGIVQKWKPIIERLLMERNDSLPEMTEANLGAIIPLIIQKIHANRQ